MKYDERPDTYASKGWHSYVDTLEMRLRESEKRVKEFETGHMKPGRVKLRSRGEYIELGDEGTIIDFNGVQVSFRNGLVHVHVDGTLYINPRASNHAVVQYTNRFLPTDVGC